MKTNEQSGGATPVLVLLSGGLDSTACLDFYLSQRCSVRALYFQYGQAAAKREREAAERVSHHYGVPLQVVACRGSGKKGKGEVLGRNAFLLSAAMMESAGANIVAIGVHAGTSYYDCSPQFIEWMQRILDAYSSGCVRIGTPFLTWTKRDIWDYCLQRAVPLALTYSCELGMDQPCGQCLSCHDLEVLHAGT